MCKRLKDGEFTPPDCGTPEHVRSSTTHGWNLSAGQEASSRLRADIIDRLPQLAVAATVDVADGIFESSTGLVLDIAKHVRRSEKRPAITAGSD